jgi:hypothetical protein
MCTRNVHGGKVSASQRVTEKAAEGGNLTTPQQVVMSDTIDDDAFHCQKTSF